MGKKFRYIAALGYFMTVLAVSTTLARRPPDGRLRLAPASEAMNFIDFYEEVAHQGKAPLITTDSALWAVGEFQAQVRAELDLQAQKHRLERILKNLDAALRDARNGGAILGRSGDQQKIRIPRELEPASDLARDYVRIALALLEPSANLPMGLEKEIQRIKAADAIATSTLCAQVIDYRNFVLPVQYARTEDMQNFGRARLWLAHFWFRYDDRVKGRRMLKTDPPRLRGGWFTGIDALEAGNGDIRQMRVLEEVYPEEGLLEMRAAALLALFLESVHVDSRPLMGTWKKADVLETAWVGPSQTPGPVELVEGLKRKIGEDAWSINEALDLLASDYDTLVYIAWLESRVRQPEDLEDTGRRGFAFLGARPAVESQILHRMARHEKWQAGFVGDNEPFTLAQLGIEFFRGWPRGYDLAAALQNNLDARKFLEESGDTEYYYYRRQRRAAREVWLRASDSGEFSCAEKWDLPWADRLPVRVQLLQVAQMSAEPSRAVRPDVYVWQDAHRLARLNTSLAYCAWLNHEYAPAGFYQTNDVLKPLNAHVGNEGKQAAGYIDPFPHVYERLADSCRRMADLCEEHLGPKNPTTRRCIEMQALMKRAEEVAVNEITKPDSMALADARWIDQWAAHLRNALNDESLSGIYVGRDARDSVAVAAVPWMRRSRALQMATGPLWALQTTVAVGEEDREVVGAIFSFYEFKSDSSALVGNADWRAMLSSGTAGAPLLLRQLVPPPAVTSRLNDIVEASPHNKMEPQMAR